MYTVVRLNLQRGYSRQLDYAFQVMEDKKNTGLIIVNDYLKFVSRKI